MNKTKTPSTIRELRNELLEAYQWVKEDPRRAEQVKEMTNAAGKIIGTLKIELEYAMLRREKPTIDFLGGAPLVELDGDTPNKALSAGGGNLKR